MGLGLTARLRLLLVLTVATPCLPFPIPGGFSHVPVQHPKLAAKPSTFHGVPLLSKSGPAPAPAEARRGLKHGRSGVGASQMALKSQSNDAVGSLLDDLLCQRAVQTELVHLRHAGDDFKTQWLENFLHHEGLGSFHGFGALRVPAMEYLSAMFNSQPMEHEIKVKVGHSLVGGSKNNPYLEQGPQYKYYTETVHPQKMCKGIMAIREELRDEWISDIPVMAKEDDNFVKAIQRKEEELGVQMQNLSGAAGSTRTLRKGNGTQAQQAAAELRGGLVRADIEEEWELVRQGLTLESSLGTREGSSLRSANYDVLKKAATYVAVKRLLVHWARDSKRKGALEWFRPRWEARYQENMRGDSGRHLTERFLLSIARSPPAAVNTPRGGLQMVTPSELAMDIVEERRRVVQLFLGWLQSDRVQEEHLGLQLDLLQRSLDAPYVMAKPGWEALEAALKAPAAAGPEVRGRRDIAGLWRPGADGEDSDEVLV